MRINAYGNICQDPSEGTLVNLNVWGIHFNVFHVFKNGLMHVFFL